MEFDPLKGDRQTTQLLLFNDVLLLTSKDKDGYYNLKVRAPYQVVKLHWVP